jgi:hypothetical protein
MERVMFITTEGGDDLIVSFAVQSRDDPMDSTSVESLTLMRTPKFEFILDEHERGVRVTFDRHDRDDDDFLQKVEYAESEAIIRIQTSSRKYELDLRKVGPDDLKRMRQILKKMNYDQKFQASGI